MFDFLKISTRSTKRGVIEVYPKFIIGNITDLIIKGGDFYAAWVEEKKLWTTDENEVFQIIDHELDNYAEENRDKFGSDLCVLHMWDSDTKMVLKWRSYCKVEMRDRGEMLNEKLIFADTATTKKDYASKKLPYSLKENGECPAYERLVSVLYSEEERRKIEWCIGSILSGDSKNIQKFAVLYGSAGTGKSTILNIIQMLFDGYYTVFDAKALGSANSQFALEAFKSNPLVAIQHDGDLSKIEDNTRLNSLVSHENMTVNEKFKSLYTTKFKCFLFMGTNKPVRITDAKSGLIRRLIDISPTGNRVSSDEYKALMGKVGFELGAIASHCLKVYLANKGIYDNYIPLAMMGASNDFYNFVLDYYPTFEKEDSVTMKAAWVMYKEYCADANVPYPASQRVFKEELKNYFRDYFDRYTGEDGSRYRSYYLGFRKERFETEMEVDIPEEKPYVAFDFKEQPSVFDKEFADCPAQYVTEDGSRLENKWVNVKTKLKDISTTRIHHVMGFPTNLIVIDFDLCDEKGEKSYEKNYEAASKWPPTYAELSKSGKGIHLHYYYDGDVSELASVYDDNIEVKVFTGGMSLRRKLTKCNDIPIAHIDSNLPLKGVKKMINRDIIYKEKVIRRIVINNLRKEYHDNTTESVNFIYKTLEDAYNSGACYDISDMRSAVSAFAAGSTHQAEQCLKLVAKMHFKSDHHSEGLDPPDNETLIFYDVEVYPNLFVICYTADGDDAPMMSMVNPNPSDVAKLLAYPLVGFNCRRYDNHVVYARTLGYSEMDLFNLSQNIINDNGDCFFGEAWNISYTDIYDFASKKQSLKKYEIELGIHHQEMDIPWDQPVPKDKIQKVVEYCGNDVMATKKLFHSPKIQADFQARKMLAALAGMTVNDSTNSLTAAIIFGKGNREPWANGAFNYRNLAEPVAKLDPAMGSFLKRVFPKMMEKPFVADGVESLLPFFPGYIFENGVSTYKGFVVGEGGFVWADPGLYYDVWTFDVTSEHPHSALAEYLFGDHTENFNDLVQGRKKIKHNDIEGAKKLLDGRLAPFLENKELISSLAKSLKIPINAVYGLTAQKTKPGRKPNPFRDERNVDNIVAKRGALFMIDLKEAVEKLGGKVVHIKTDSIKVVHPSEELKAFILSFGLRYGYEFEVEHVFEKFCLVNDAVYIAKLDERDDEDPGKWTATGAQFAVPYVFKTLFSKEPIVFDDLCETKSVSTAMYLEDGENRRFVGKVGRFTPMLEGHGHKLLRQNGDKYSSVTGAKDWLWEESEVVKALHLEEYVNKDYFRRLVDEAKKAISRYGDISEFLD